MHTIALATNKGFNGHKFSPLVLYLIISVPSPYFIFIYIEKDIYIDIYRYI